MGEASLEVHGAVEVGRVMADRTDEDGAHAAVMDGLTRNCQRRIFLIITPRVRLVPIHVNYSAGQLIVIGIRYSDWCCNGLCARHGGVYMLAYLFFLFLPFIFSPFVSPFKRAHPSNSAHRARWGWRISLSSLATAGAIVGFLCLIYISLM